MTETHEDPVFGHLIWDGCWLGGVELRPGCYVEVNVSGTDADRFIGFPAARQSLMWLRAHEPEARRQVSAEMAALYNECWTDEIKPVSVEEFAARIELVRASLGEDGSVLLSYSDGPTMMFGGHLLDAEFGPEKDYKDTYLIG